MAVDINEIKDKIKSILVINKFNLEDSQVLNLIELLAMWSTGVQTGSVLEVAHLRDYSTWLIATSMEERILHEKTVSEFKESNKALQAKLEQQVGEANNAQGMIVKIQGELDDQKKLTATMQANFEGAIAQLKEAQDEVADLKKKLADANDVITEITERNLEFLDGLVAIQDAIVTLDKKPTKRKKPLAKHLFRFYKTARGISEKLLSGGENKKPDNEGVAKLDRKFQNKLAGTGGTQ